MKKIVIIGGARDFHAMDWYRTVQKNVDTQEVIFLTDSIDGEGFKNIIESTDNIEKLFIIDKYLFRYQTRLANIWRNVFKLIILPIQIYKLKQFYKKNPNSIFHAHPVYYMLLCWLSNIEYIGTPQGSEILVRPDKSRIYKYFLKKILKNCKLITVDSLSMQKKIEELSGQEALVWQNGIDTKTILSYNKSGIGKTNILSIRGFTPLYQIDKILSSKNKDKILCSINFIYPFKDSGYYENTKKYFGENDLDLGRLSKEKLYDELSKAFLVISIPISDSSPRSVYESIFSGACVAITYNKYFEILPKCMKDRIVIVDLKNPNWLKEAINKAKDISKNKYIPSQEAINMFDENISIRKFIEKYYK